MSGNLHISLNHTDALCFKAQSDAGYAVSVGQSANEAETVRPMQLLLMSLAACSSVDVISILKKQRIEPENYTVDVNAKRQKDAVPSLFESIHLSFRFEGDILAGKLLRAVFLSLDKYCSVTKILEPTANISHSIYLNGELV
jgi:putative redox protein